MIMKLRKDLKEFAHENTSDLSFSGNMFHYKSNQNQISHSPWSTISCILLRINNRIIEDFSKIHITG